MYFSLVDVVLVLLLGAVGAWCMGAIRVREMALQHVGAASRRDDFQLLDEAVQLQRISLSRDTSGRWRIWRQYRFEYTLDGVERRQGHVIMLGRQLVAVVTSERPRVLH